MQSHARFVDRTSDFLTLLTLWDYIQERQHELLSSAFRRMCKAEFLHYLRVREWQDLVAQLRQAARSVGAKTSRQEEPARERSQADADRIHLSLLAGLLSHVAGVRYQAVAGRLPVLGRNSTLCSNQGERFSWDRTATARPICSRRSVIWPRCRPPGRQLTRR